MADFLKDVENMEERMEKLLSDREFLVAVLADLAEKLRKDGRLLKDDRTVFLPANADDWSKREMPTLLELLEGYVEERR